MKKVILLLSLIYLNTNIHAQSNSLVLKKIQFDTYLRHLDSRTLKCHQGNPDANAYPTPSLLQLKDVVLSTPSRNDAKYMSRNMNIGTPCGDLIKSFNSHKNKHGTIPVTVTITVFTGAEHDSYTLSKKNGSNVGSTGSSHNLFHELIEFNVGYFKFSSWNIFGVMRNINGHEIKDLTP